MKVTARVERDGKFWVVYVPEVDRHTQARNLREVEIMAGDLAAVMEDVDPSTVEVTEVQVKLPPSVEAHLEQARRLRRAEGEAKREAAEESRAAARELRDAGLTVRDVGAALGISYQRAHQLVSQQ